jgi:peptidoglycan/LPS O-acetylase OafA/YrhL
MKTHRINILDGFRTLAILSVILYHFFNRYIDEQYYPYGADYGYFAFGNLGVHFFFIISGFVIFYTLENTKTIKGFWWKRLVRLFPSIFVATVLTYFFCIYFDSSNLFPDSHKLTNFIPSLTFLNPDLLNSIFPLNTDYINGSYWSLWIEIEFYVLASVLYFTKKEWFVPALMFFMALMVVYQFRVFLHLPAFAAKPMWWLFSATDFKHYLSYFCLGVLFYKIFKNKQNAQPTSNFIKISFLFLISYTCFFAKDPILLPAFCVMLLLFFGFIYKPEAFRIFGNKQITRIGVSSYFLYLIHENIGVILINRLGDSFQSFAFLWPILLTFFFIVLSIFYTEKVDKKVNRYLNSLVRSKESADYRTINSMLHAKRRPIEKFRLKLLWSNFLSHLKTPVS